VRIKIRKTRLRLYKVMTVSALRFSYAQETKKEHGKNAILMTNRCLKEHS
jgi:hypothetical protein